MTVQNASRRTVLKAAGGALAVSFAAGCLGGGDSAGGDVDDWMDDANGYEGVDDHTGEDSVTVEVGAGSAGTGFAPAAIEIDAGTTVVWEWTGVGGEHDVVENDGAFESDPHTDEGETFEHTFEESGTYTYYCTPHEAVGMKGAVVVE